MPSTAPETRASTAATRNGTSTQTGSSVARAPIGSSATASKRSGSEPASSVPKITSSTGASEPPIVFQAMIAPSEAERF